MSLLKPIRYLKKKISKTEFGRVVLDWLTSLNEAMISGSGSIEYIPVLNSHSAVTSARLAVEILRILRILSKYTLSQPTQSVGGFEQKFMKLSKAYLIQRLSML